ncbi:relaxase/mobilization nuclease domain-containing protein [Dyadobacter sp. CY351]|uniref:relaxase/mobilization nuclease domain-containing protein n=1 Tax=Dyadobacter sp. CY351 TaxID=2909337 RepID=UPI001F311B88|nr:relaxase/mobilization nuclease domain-containing protein [Dyadobacter sp. CY351]MCF2516989.1 relaxase/mobilization nuclease domain-containing protein [Dyadobacter sp. CY351]
MIGKIMIGSSFGGAIRYVMQKEKAVVLHGEGIRTQDVKSAIHDFNGQRLMNPELGKAVGHLVLSWSAFDKDKLSQKIMVHRAAEYMAKMKIQNTQYLVVEHRDTNQPHIHILYNRVDNAGKSISDQFQKRMNQKVCKEMTLKHGYYIGKGKTLVNRGKLRGKDKIRYELADQIRIASRSAVDWKQLEGALSSSGIALIYKYKSGTNQIQGISFEKDGKVLKGSKVDRSMSFPAIDRTLRENFQHQLAVRCRMLDRGILPPAQEKMQTHRYGLPNYPEENLLKDLMDPVNQRETINPELNRKHKRKKSRGLHL